MLDSGLRPAAVLFDAPEPGPFLAPMMWVGHRLFYSSYAGVSPSDLWSQIKGDMTQLPRYLKGHLWSEGRKAPVDFPPAAAAEVLLPTDRSDRVVVIQSLSDQIEVQWNAATHAVRPGIAAQTGIGIYTVPDGAQVAHSFTRLRPPEPEAMDQGPGAVSPWVPLFVDADARYLYALSAYEPGTAGGYGPGFFIRIDLKTGSQSWAVPKSQEVAIPRGLRFNNMALPVALDDGKAFAVVLQRPERLDGFCYLAQRVDATRSDVTCVRAKDGKIVQPDIGALVTWTNDGRLVLGNWDKITSYDPKARTEKLLADHLWITWVGGRVGPGGILVQARRLKNARAGKELSLDQYSALEWGILLTGKPDSGAPIPGQDQHGAK